MPEAENIRTEPYTPTQGGETKTVDRVLQSLASLPYDDLKAVAERAKALLDAKEKERQKQAIKEIQDLAAKHGLQVEVKGQRKRRGRPPKTPTAE